MRVLDGLHDVQWDALRDACGDASAIPRALTSLVDAEASERAAARERLWAGLCNERVTLSEATAYAVPFLVSLAVAPAVFERGELFTLLHAIAVLAREEAAADEAVYRRASANALARAAPHLEAALSDPDDDVRARAALLGAEATEGKARSRFVRALQAAFARESNVDVRVAYTWALSRLGACAALRTAREDGAYGVRLAAALGCLGRSPPDDDAIAIVRDALRAPAASEARYGTAARFRALSWFEDVCERGVEAARALAPELFARLLEGHTARVHRELAPLLACFFPLGVPAIPDRFQTALALTIARHPRYFGRNGDAGHVLLRHGLPARAKPLRAYAARGPEDAAHLVPVPPATRSAEDTLTRAARGVPIGELRALELMGEGDDDVLCLAATLPLTQLLLGSMPVGRKGFAALAASRSLRLLELVDLTLDASALDALAASASLRSLTLVDVSLAEGALAGLSGLSQLRFLRLCATQGSADDLLALAGMSLETLKLEELEGPLSLEVVPKLPRLTQLGLEGSSVAPAALSCIAGAAGLKKLDLRGVPLTRAHIEALEGASLDVLQADRTGWDEAFTARLAQRLPTLRVQLR